MNTQIEDVAQPYSAQNSLVKLNIPNNNYLIMPEDNIDEDSLVTDSDVPEDLLDPIQRRATRKKLEAQGQLSSDGSSRASFAQQAVAYFSCPFYINFKKNKI